MRQNRTRYDQLRPAGSLRLVKAMRTGPASARDPMDLAQASSAVQADLLLVLQSLPEGLLIVNPQWQLVFANDQARRISRLAEHHLNGPTLWEIYPALLGSELEPVYRRVMAGGATEQIDSFYEPFDLWVRLRFSGTASGLAVYYSDITNLKQTEQARDKTSAQLNEVFDTTTDGVLALDRNWCFTFFNRRAREILAAKGDLLGQNVWHRFPDAVFDGSPYVENYFRTMIHRERTTFEAFYPAPLDAWLRVETLPSESGIIVFFRDVTQQREDEAALRSSEERYRILTELNPQAIWTGTPDGRVTYANQRFLDYIGHDFIPEDGTEYLNCFALEDRGRVFRRWAHSVQTGEEYDIEARLTRASDGADRWWHLRALPLRNGSGEITMWLGVANDIDQQRNAASELRRQQAETEQERALIEAIYRTAPVGLALFDPIEFRYLRVNQAQTEILGRPADQLIGRRLGDVVPFNALDGAIPDLRAGKTIRNLMSEGSISGKPEDLRSYNVNYSPVLANDGSMFAISAAVLDITQQRKAEAALVQSEKLAAVGRLASSISHEINNPLEAITNLLYLTASEEDLPMEARQYITTAQAELSRVSQIATQTLRFHRQANDPSRVTPAQLIDAVLNLYQGRLVNSGIRVQASYATARTIHCFENDIRQVLNNLIGNAIDAMRNGGRLRVRAHDAIDFRTGRRGCRIVIADTGHGMGAETLSRIFDAFYTTKQLNGTGLGLWISSGIVERHRGRLKVRSSQDHAMHGTVFTLFLPADHA